MEPYQYKDKVYNPEVVVKIFWSHIFWHICKLSLSPFLAFVLMHWFVEIFLRFIDRTTQFVDVTCSPERSLHTMLCNVFNELFFKEVANISFQSNLSFGQKNAYFNMP